jgi:prevent-host-death family protein
MYPLIRLKIFEQLKYWRRVMQKIIGVTELQRRFRPVFDEVVKNKMPFILTRGSRPEAALIPYEDYLRFQEMEESEVLARFDQVWARLGRLNTSFTDEEVALDIAAARAELGK